MRIPLTVYGFHLQFADSTCNLRISLTAVDSERAQSNYSNVLSFVCGFRKMFWIPQVQLQIPQNCLFWSDFERSNVLGICLWNPEQQRRSKIPRQIWFWPVAGSAYNAQNAQFGLVMVTSTWFLIRKKKSWRLQILIEAIRLHSKSLVLLFLQEKVSIPVLVSQAISKVWIHFGLKSEQEWLNYVSQRPLMNLTWSWTSWPPWTRIS